jgi:hypothetical protein
LGEISGGISVDLKNLESFNTGIFDIYYVLILRFLMSE